MSYIITRYHPEHKQQWDDFVRTSNNTTFLFYRDFMEYHSDRFEDHSLMVFKKEKIQAILPGHTLGKTYCSHLGLTYGGLIFKESIGVDEVKTSFEVVKDYLKEKGYDEMLIKVLPMPYQSEYSSALEYVMFSNQAHLQRRDLNYFVDLGKPLQIHKSKLKFKKKGLWDELKILKTSSSDSFWNDLLIPVLKEQYGNAPVHTASEIKLLMNQFPDNIIQYNVMLNNELIAGMTLFISGNTLKSQYGVANAIGKEYRALDYLYISLLEHFKKQGFSHFDMGTTNTGDGTTYNKGLSKYKEEFGAKPYNQDRYLVKL